MIDLAATQISILDGYLEEFSGIGLVERVKPFLEYIQSAKNSRDLEKELRTDERVIELFKKFYIGLALFGILEKALGNFSTEDSLQSFFKLHETMSSIADTGLDAANQPVLQADGKLDAYWEFLYLSKLLDGAARIVQDMVSKFPEDIKDEGLYFGSLVNDMEERFSVLIPRVIVCEGSADIATNNKTPNKGKSYTTKKEKTNKSSTTNDKTNKTSTTKDKTNNTSTTKDKKNDKSTSDVFFDKKMANWFVGTYDTITGEKTGGTIEATTGQHFRKMFKSYFLKDGGSIRLKKLCLKVWDLPFLNLEL